MKKSWILIVLFFFATSAYAAQAVQHLIYRGMLAWQKNDYKTAIAYFKRAVDENPDDGDTIKLLGMAYYNDGQYREAINTLNRSLNATHNKDRENESWMFLSLSQDKLGLWDSAISSRKKYIELKPDDPDGFSNLAKLYIWNKQFDEAITAAKRAIELKADNAYAYYYLGAAYGRKNQYNEAIKAFKKAIEIDPTNALFRNEMGALFYDKEDYAEAIEALKKAVELQPNNIKYLFSMANCYRLMGKYDDAIAVINKVIALQTYAGVGIALANESGYPVAKEVLETGPAQKAGIEPGDRIREINGKSTKGLDNEKASQILRGTSGTQVVLTIEREGARKSIDKTVTKETMIDKDAASSLGVRSNSFRHKGSLEAALQDAEKAYSLDPADSWARYSQGAAYLDQRHYDESVKLLSQVKGPRARVLEATAYAKQGKMKEAEDIYFAIPEEELSPKNIPLMKDRMELLQIFKPIVREHRIKAKSFEAKGRYQEALFELSEALKTADETEAQEIRESIFSITKMNPSLSKMLPEEARECVLRAEMLVKEGDFEKAAGEYVKAVRIAPYAVRLYYNSALIHAQLKKYPEAIRQMDIYLQAVPDAPDARAAKDEIIKWKFMMEKEK